MGQYYRPVLETEKEKFSFSSYDFGNGAKLMEHSYIGNTLVRRVENEILNSPKRLTWAGDYADPIKGSNPEINLFEAVEVKKSSKEDAEVVSDSCNLNPNSKGYKYLVNHTKKEWCSNTGKKRSCGLTISRLPLLTADGNGRGGGDYHGEDMKYVGSWAGDLIEIVNDLSPLKGYKRIAPKFYE